MRSHAAGRQPFAAPIDAVLPEALARLSEGRNLVLQAPPGAGKTTRLPLALLDADWTRGARIVLLEPRRVAARAAAARMAETLGEAVGATVGYRIRDEAKVSARTRIEVVTEGILTRKLQGDPSLEGVAVVVFDEFHERSIHADLGLALCLEAQAALRPDLRLVVMSATLDGDAVAALTDGAIVTSAGRSFPVETRWLDKPEKIDARRRLDRAAADLTRRALADPEGAGGDLLVFLPGAREIRGAAQALADLGREADIRPLYGELPAAEQRLALTPGPTGRRKIVLASAIAETSLTIPGVTVVVDSGRSRRLKFDPRSGMGRLITERVSRAAAEQRRGRAGRVAPGLCYRLWTKGEEGGLRPFDPPEILEADLAPMALELAQWGARPGALAFLDAPPPAAYAQAEDLLGALGALDAGGRLTDHGRAMAAAPLHPRLAHMALSAGASRDALRLAALLEERDPLRLDTVDLAPRLKAIAAPDAHPAAAPALRRIAERAKKLRRRLPERAAPLAAAGPAALAALAYPDRIALRRKSGAQGGPVRHLLSNGKGAALAETDPLASAPLLVALDLDGDQREAKIRLAAPVALSELETLFSARIDWVAICEWSKREGRVVARRRRMLGAIALEDRIWDDAPAERMAAAMADGVRQLGLEALPWTPAAERFRARVARARTSEPTLPDLCDEALLAELDTWLVPHLIGLRSRDDLAGLDVLGILKARLDWERTQALDRLAPSHFTAPTGSRAPVDYAGAAPRVAIRLQELFGLSTHPRIAGAPILFDLLSPAQRPIQTTADLPGFWAGSYADVRKDMRARYPKHVWPEDPSTAAPTTKAKPRS